MRCRLSSDCFRIPHHNLALATPKAHVKPSRPQHSFKQQPQKVQQSKKRLGERPATTGRPFPPAKPPPPPAGTRVRARAPRSRRPAATARSRPSPVPGRVEVKKSVFTTTPAEDRPPRSDLLLQRARRPPPSSSISFIQQQSSSNVGFHQSRRYHLHGGGGGLLLLPPRLVLPCRRTLLRRRFAQQVLRVEARLQVAPGTPRARLQGLRPRPRRIQRRRPQPQLQALHSRLDTEAHEL